jgi:hypothetical protein
MSEFKGTKGKWAIKKNIEGCFLISGENWEDFCEVVTVTDGTDFDGKFAEQAQANALLISKAPEMLEMLEKLKYRLDWFNDDVSVSEIKQLIKEATQL